MPTTIIGLTGKLGSGKTTLAEKIIEHWGGTRVSFARPVKDAALAACNRWVEPWLTDLFGEKYNPDMKAEVYQAVAKFNAKPGEKNRDLLQWFGTDFGRRYDPDVWVKWTERNLPVGLVIIDDCRFPNEAEMIQRLGGRVFRMVRPELDRIKSALQSHKVVTLDQLSHASETSLDSSLLPNLMAESLDQLDVYAANLRWRDPLNIRCDSVGPYEEVCCALCLRHLRNSGGGVA